MVGEARCNLASASAGSSSSRLWQLRQILMRSLKGGESVICPLIIQIGEGQQIQSRLSHSE